MNVVITGSTRGLGYELAEQFLKNGHSVLINSRDRMDCALISGKLQGLYPNSIIHIYACDVTCFNSVERMFWEASRYFGSVDIWINNAGAGKEIEDKINGTNVAISGMKSARGSICNITAKKNRKSLMSFSKSISAEIKDSNIKLYTINPNLILLRKKAPFIVKILTKKMAPI